jgi:hypothetical protein
MLPITQAMLYRLPLQPASTFVHRLFNPVVTETTPERIEQARLEQAFFIEVIQLAPKGTDLVITSDSWDGLPLLFGERMTRPTESNHEEWVVALTPENREFVMQQALYDDLYISFVHFYLVANHRELLASYDRMACLILDPGFPKYHHILARYSGLGDRIG